MHFCLMRDDIAGPVNLVAPDAVTNRTFTDVLARVLSRPALAPAPAFALRLALGAAMADATVLASQRVIPEVLQQKGFRWRFPDLEQALRFELGQSTG
jgi:NAD dependent epimerase/dehydratase family enzyme